MLGRLLSGKAIGTDELVVRDTKFLDADENIDWEKWAPNGGRVPGTIKENQTIPAGTIIDRYGSQWGKYTSPAGVPYEQRALPYIENPNAYHKYEVLKPIDNVTISEIAPAFEQVGIFIGFIGNHIINSNLGRRTRRSRQSNNGNRFVFRICHPFQRYYITEFRIIGYNTDRLGSIN